MKYSQTALLERFESYLEYRRDALGDVHALPENFMEGMCFAFSYIQAAYKLEGCSELFLEQVNMMLDFDMDKMLTADPIQKEQVSATFDSYISAGLLLQGVSEVYHSYTQKQKLSEKIKTILPESFHHYMETDKTGATLSFEGWESLFEKAFMHGRMMVIEGTFFDITEWHAISIVFEEVDGQRIYTLMDPNGFLNDKGEEIQVTSAKALVEKIMQAYTYPAFNQEKADNADMGLAMTIYDGPECPEKRNSILETLLSLDIYGKDPAGNTTLSMMVMAEDEIGTRLVKDIILSQQGFSAESDPVLRSMIEFAPLSILKLFQGAKETDKAFIERMMFDDIIWTAIAGNDAEKLEFALNAGATIEENMLLEAAGNGRKDSLAVIIDKIKDMSYFYDDAKDIQDLEEDLVYYAISSQDLDTINYLVDEKHFSFDIFKNVDTVKEAFSDISKLSFLKKMLDMGHVFLKQDILDLAFNKNHVFLKHLKESGKLSKKRTLYRYEMGSLIRDFLYHNPLSECQDFFKLFSEDVLVEKSSSRSGEFKSVLTDLVSYMDSADPRMLQKLKDQNFIPNAEMLKQSANDSKEFFCLWNSLSLFSKILPEPSELKYFSQNKKAIEDEVLGYLHDKQYHNLLDEMLEKDPTLKDRHGHHFARLSDSGVFDMEKIKTTLPPSRR